MDTYQTNLTRLQQFAAQHGLKLNPDPARVEKVVGESTVVIADGLLTPPPNGGLRLTPHYNRVDGRAESGAVSWRRAMASCRACSRS